jgi:hypothetical protein
MFRVRDWPGEQLLYTEAADGGRNRDQQLVQLRKVISLVENFGGRQGIRTPGLIVANDALSQLS